MATLVVMMMNVCLYLTPCTLAIGNQVFRDIEVAKGGEQAISRESYNHLVSRRDSVNAIGNEKPSDDFIMSTSKQKQAEYYTDRNFFYFLAQTEVIEKAADELHYVKDELGILYCHFDEYAKYGLRIKMVRG